MLDKIGEWILNFYYEVFSFLGMQKAADYVKYQLNDKVALIAGILLVILIVFNAIFITKKIKRWLRERRANPSERARYKQSLYGRDSGRSLAEFLEVETAARNGVSLPGKDRAGDVAEYMLCTAAEEHYDRDVCFADSYFKLRSVAKSGVDSTEVDLIIVTTKGLLVFECKDYKGIIRGDISDEKWVKLKQSRSGNIIDGEVRNPFTQNRGHVMAVLNVIKRTMFEGQRVSDADVIRKIPIYSVIVLKATAAGTMISGRLDNNSFIVKLRGQTMPHGDVTVWEIKDFFNQIDSLPPRISEEEVKNLASGIRNDRLSGKDKEIARKKHNSTLEGRD